MMNDIKVVPILHKEAYPWILLRHYARRICPISYAFGAYSDNKLVGIVTYGTPVSSPLRIGIAGEKYAENVVELNRLCCDNERNIASIIVGRSLRMLPKPSIVVSYADTAQGHIGYVYQATNFIYTGLSEKRTDWKVKGKENLHGATVADESRGQKNRAKWMREKYGDDFYLAERPRKHRYVFLCGNTKQRREMRKSLKYDEKPYPKGDTRRYDDFSVFTTQDLMKL